MASSSGIARHGATHRHFSFCLSFANYDSTCRNPICDQLVLLTITTTMSTRLLLQLLLLQLLLLLGDVVPRHSVFRRDDQ